MVQSADLVLDTASTNLRLMLARNHGVRQWARKRLPRRPSISPEAPIEVTYEWRSWHEGDGLSRIRDPRPGLQPPRAAYGTCTTRYPGKIMPAAKSQTVAITVNDTAPRVAFSTGSTVAVIAGKTAQRLTYSPDTWTAASTQVLDAVAEANDVERFGSLWYVSTPGDPSWSVNSAGTWTQAGAGLSYDWTVLTRLGSRFYFQGAGGLVKFVEAGADPFNSANHSAGTSVSGFTLTGLNALGRVLYFMHLSGFAYYDLELNIVNPIPELDNVFNQTITDSLFGKNTISWHGGLLIPTTKGMFWYTDGLLAPVGPDMIADNEDSTFGGYVIGLTADTVWVYALTSGLAVLAGRERTSSDGQGEPFVWFHIGDLVSTPTTCAMVQANTAPSFLFYPDDSGTDAVFMHIPSNPGPRAYLEDTYFFTTSSSSKTLPKIYLGQPGTTAYLKSVEIDVEDANANNAVQVSYDLDGSGSFTNLGSAVTSNGRTELSFAASTSAREAQIRVTLTHNSTDTPVKVRRVALNVSERSRKTSIWSAVARIGYGVTDRNGSEMPGDPDEIMTTLYAWEVSGSALAITDPGGVARNVIILNVEDAEAEDEDESHDSKRLVTITMQEV